MIDKIQESIDRLDSNYDPIKDRMEMFDSTTTALLNYPNTPEYKSHVEFVTMAWNSLFYLLMLDGNLYENELPTTNPIHLSVLCNANEMDNFYAFGGESCQLSGERCIKNNRRNTKTFDYSSDSVIQ